MIMHNDDISHTDSYEALTVVSGMILGDESKDQDRAGWCQPGQIACVCDGVSSSPNSAQAAELVTTLIPAVLQGNISDRLGMVCDLLMAQRQQPRDMTTLTFPENTPVAMQEMLRKVVQQKQCISFQTTLVAIRIMADEQVVNVQILKCGDSAFFAFSPNGQLLTSSLVFPANTDTAFEVKTQPTAPKTILFGPGDDILVRVESELAAQSPLAQQAGIRARHAVNWLVCTPVDGCRDDNQPETENLSELQQLSLRPGDQLLVPKYLHGTQLSSSDGRHYRILPYSSTIRPVFSHGSVTPINTFDDHGSATMVLPDHFYSGGFDSFPDRFPAQTHFVLCSDGFYGSFPHARAMWQWLQRNAAGLRNPEQRTSIMEQLHQTLHRRGGDDDISFVWAFPTSAANKSVKDRIVCKM